MLLDDSSGATIEVTCGRQAPAPSMAGVTEPDVPLSASSRAAVSGLASTPTGLTATGRTVDLSGVDVGAVVKVKGGVGVFRGEKQVVMERICTFVFLFPLISFSRPFQPLHPRLPSHAWCSKIYEPSCN